MLSTDENSKKWIDSAKEKGHELVIDSAGNLDFFVYESGHCNGPGCKKCGDSWCWHCKSVEDISECAEK